MLSIFVIIALLVVQVYSFGATIGLRRASRAGSLSMMSTGGKLDMLGLIPLCLEASSTTTTSNDPTAGMSPDEITNYISNVGGGMCGYPEAVRTGVGLGLNLSLFVFGVLTVGYLVLGLWNFALEQSVDSYIKKLPNGQALLDAANKEDVRQGALFNTAQSTSYSASAAFDMDPLKASQQVVIEDDREVMLGGGGDEPTGPAFQNDGNYDGTSPVGKSRAERRMQSRLKKGEKG